MGNELDKKESTNLRDILDFLNVAATEWGTRSASFLGGEPTLFRDIDRCIDECNLLGLEASVVTNGGRAARKLLDRRCPSDLSLSVSIDGLSRTHDRIRGLGSHSDALATIAKAVAQGFAVSAVVTVGRGNEQDVLPALQNLSNLGVQRVRMHFASARGAAADTDVLSPEKWGLLRRSIERSGLADEVSIRYENGFHQGSPEFSCAVLTGGELLLMPDNRVFTCSMFIDLPDGHQYVWSEQRLHPNVNFDMSMVKRYAARGGCPAMFSVDPGLVALAAEAGLSVDCIFNKSLIDSTNTQRREHVKQ